MADDRPCDGFPCSKCTKTFPKRRYLTQHVRRNHEPNGRQLKCHHCQYAAKLKHHLIKHMRRHFRASKLRKVYACVLCRAFECDLRNAMVQHYADVHRCTVSGECFWFEKFDEFLKWKDRIEQDDACRFICPNGPKVRKGVQVRYYRCFRDGIFHSGGTGKRRLKTTGSVKIGGICPASMKVETGAPGGGVKVVFINNHVGHGHELGRVNLSKSERALIASRLARNVPHEAILREIWSSKDDAIRRIHLTTRKDMWNVKASLESGHLNSCLPTTAQLPRDSSEIHSQILQPFDSQNDDLFLITDGNPVQELSGKEAAAILGDDIGPPAKETVREKFEEILDQVLTDDYSDVMWNVFLPAPSNIPTLEYDFTNF